MEPQPHPFVYILLTAFMLQWQNWVVVTEAQMFTVFTDKAAYLCIPCSKTWGHKAKGEYLAVVITEIPFAVHTSHSFIPEPCFHFLNSHAQDIAYVMCIFFIKIIVHDFCIEEFPEFLPCRGLALFQREGSWDLTWNCICRASSPNLLCLYSCLFWFEVGNQNWEETRISSSQFLTITTFVFGKKVRVSITCLCFHFRCCY